MVSEWRREPLSKLAEFINGRAFKPEEWGTQGLPIIRIANLNNPDAEFDYYSGTVDDRHLIQHGDLLLSWSASLGAYKWKGENAVLNQHIFKVVPSQYVNKDFLYYLLDRSVEKLKERVHGSTMKHIKKGELDDLQVEVPPLYEQRKIAAILSSVDEAIKKTEAIIEQTEKVKKGLMQQLLTRGIGHTKFKKTEIGEIPEEWEVKTIGEIGSLKSGTTPSREKAELYYKGGEIPWVKTMDLNNSFIVDTHEKVTNLALEETSLSIIPKGSVLVAMYGGFNQIGRTGLLKIDATINQALTAILINTELIEPEFLLIWLNYKVNHWKKFAASSRKDPNITKNDVANFPVVIPSLEEQRKIYTTILNISKKIENEIIKKQQLQTIKKALMQILLTGKVRVKVDNEVMSQ